jgi:hypothetical protein
LSFYRASDWTVRPKIATCHFADERNHSTVGRSGLRIHAGDLQDNEMAVRCSIVLDGFAPIFVWWRSEGA